jgi:hypothetical protein
MKLLSSTDLAIACAIKANTLRLVERASRFGDTFIAIEDGFGTIEVADDMAQANARIAAIQERAQ